MELATLYRDIVETSPDAIWVFDPRVARSTRTRRCTRSSAPRSPTWPGSPSSTPSTTTGKQQFADHLDQLRAGRVNDGEVETHVRPPGRQRRSGWVTIGESFLTGRTVRSGGVLHRITDANERRRRARAGQAADDSPRRNGSRASAAGSGTSRRTRSGARTSQSPSTRLDPASFPAKYDDFLDIVHGTTARWSTRPVRGALRDGGDFLFVARVQGPTKSWIWTRGRPDPQVDETGRVTHGYGTPGHHRDQAGRAGLEDQVRQNTLMQAVARCRQRSRDADRGALARPDLVLFHDDWERGGRS